MGSDEQFKEVLENLDKTTVKEEKEEEIGSLSINEKLSRIIEEIKKQDGAEIDVAEEKAIEIVRLFFEGESDKEISETIDTDESEVRDIRGELYLQRSSDLDEAPFDLDEIKTSELSISEKSEKIDIEENIVRFYSRIMNAENKPYRERFEEVLSDEGIAERMTSEVKEKGLKEATEDMEVGVDI